MTTPKKENKYKYDLATYLKLIMPFCLFYTSGATLFDLQNYYYKINKY